MLCASANCAIIMIVWLIISARKTMREHYLLDQSERAKSGM